MFLPHVINYSLDLYKMSLSESFLGISMGTSENLESVCYRKQLGEEVCEQNASLFIFRS